MSDNLSNHPVANPSPVGRGLIALLAITLLGSAMAYAGDPEKAAGVMTAMAPKTARSHMDAITQSFQQFMHWQMMLRILLGFGLAVACGWFIAWHPRRSTKSAAAADLEETKTLILLGMVGAAVAEISKLDEHMAFVIFGIGALVRFRTVMDNPKVTGKAIMVVVIGLACGMNQWAMAAFVTGLTWVLVYWLDSHISARFKIRVTAKQEVRMIYGEVQDFLRMHRCRVKASSLYESKRSMLIALITSLAIISTQTPAVACTRALYVARNGTVLTGRSMDWGEDMHSNMWVLPRGMKRDGMGGKNTVTWESKYGSLVVSAYDIGTCDGLNEKGLTVNMLALVESNYGKPAEGGKVICMSTWAQYLLDLHANVADAVADLRKEEFRVQTIVLPTGRPANMHLAISDATGDSAIFEYVNGKLVIHHGKDFKVLTNSPTYDQQLAIMEYWKLAGGLTKMLPGTSNDADRFVRASFLLGALPVETSKNYISGSPQQ